MDLVSSLALPWYRHGSLLSLLLVFGRANEAVPAVGQVGCSDVPQEGGPDFFLIEKFFFFLLSYHIRQI